MKKIGMINMELYLRDRNQGMCEAWERMFYDETDVHISQGDIFADGPHMTADAIVSPANSFGFMDGGIDQVYTDFFGQEMVDDLQGQIKKHWCGELPVGCCQHVFIHTITDESRGLRHLLSCPTMRVPCDVSQTVNAYLALRAAIIEGLRRSPGIRSILCPGLGTAVGRMPYDLCAAQMKYAWVEMGVAKNWRSLGAASSMDHLLRTIDQYPNSLKRMGVI